MYAMVVWHKVRAGARQELFEAARQDAPDMAATPGLVAYHVLELPGEQYATVGVFEDKEAADNWVAISREHARSHGLGEYLDDPAGRARGFAGNVVFSALARS